MGALIVLAILICGLALAHLGLGLRGAMAVAVGASLGLLGGLAAITLLLQAGLSLPAAVGMAPLPMALCALWAWARPAVERANAAMSKGEQAGLLAAVVLVWLYTNGVQAIAVDDDYWLHTPVQARLLHGVYPPTNPFFPDLVLGGHFSRDLLVVSTSVASGRDIFGAQVLATSLCHALGLAVLYLGLRRQGSVTSAVGGTWLVWFGMNVSSRVGLIDFFQNNGALAYLSLAVLGVLFCELWSRPEPRLTLLAGSLLGFYSLIYESHFGLLVLALLTLLLWFDRDLWRPTLAALGLAGLLALTGGGALSRMSTQSEPLAKAVANQSQTVQLSFPKQPFLALRIAKREPGPVSVGYRTGIGPTLLALVDREPERIDDQYVSLFGWMVLRMHWLGLWLAPVSALILWRARHRLGQLLWLFGMWAYLIPGMVNFGEVHEYEWYRWEFAAGYGFAAAAGVSLGALALSRRPRLALGLTVLLFSSSGLAFTARTLPHLASVPVTQLLGMSFPTQSWLLRHGKHLRLDESDLRTLAWLQTNSRPGEGALFVTTRSTNPWDLLFESTAMGLTQVQAVGHRLPPDTDPIGLPPYRMLPAVDHLLDSPTLEKARALGAKWIYLRSDDLELEARMLGKFRLVYLDGLSWDGKRRLLLQVPPESEATGPLVAAEVDATWLSLADPPAGTQQIGLRFFDSASGRSWSHGPIPPVSGRLALAVPETADTVQLSYLGASQELELRRLEVQPVRRP